MTNNPEAAVVWRKNPGQVVVYLEREPYPFDPDVGEYTKGVWLSDSARERELREAYRAGSERAYWKVNCTNQPDQNFEEPPNEDDFLAARRGEK